MSLIISGHGAAFNQGELSSSGFLHCALRGSLCNLGLIVADGEVQVEVEDQYTSHGSGVTGSNCAAVSLRACTVSLSQEACISAGQELSLSCRDLHLKSRGTQLVAQGNITVRSLHMENRGKVHSGRVTVLTIGRRTNKHVITLKASANFVVGAPNEYFREVAARAAPPPAPAPTTDGNGAKDESKNKEEKGKNKEDEEGKGPCDDKSAEGAEGRDDEELGFPDEGELVNLGGVIIGTAGVTITASSRVSNACSADGFAAAVLVAAPCVGPLRARRTTRRLMQCRRG